MITFIYSQEIGGIALSLMCIAVMVLCTIEMRNDRKKDN